MSVRVTEEIISVCSGPGDILCAGTCGIVKEHIKEGRKFDDKNTVFLKVDWEHWEPEGCFNPWSMFRLDNIVINEH